jgi:hypothetical protein
VGASGVAPHIRVGRLNGLGGAGRKRSPVLL